MEISDHHQEEEGDEEEDIPSSPSASTMQDHGNNNNNHVTPDGSSSNAYQDQAVKDPHPNDVLCGRGGNINSHPGNERFRTLVDRRKRVYLTARFKREKRLIASSIVSEIRALKPSGRFLSQDKKSGLWKDIGDEKARDKTSQALRENAPTIRAKIETEINEQRSEMTKDEDQHQKMTATTVTSTPGAAAHAPPAPSYYGGWGPYAYYGYAQHSHPPPPPPQVRYYPPPPTTSEVPIWGSFYPPQPAGAAAATSSSTTQQQQPKSVIEQTADYINSGAESVKSWTKASFSFGGDVSLSGTINTNDHNNNGGSLASVASQPLSYVHQDDSKKRRIVKFRSDTKRTSRRRTAGNQQPPMAYPDSGSSTNSLFADHGSITAVDSQGGGQEIEPHNLDDEQNNSLMTQVANQILGSIGSWDTGSILCGNDNSDRHDVPFPRNHHHSGASASSAMAGGGGGALADELEDDMAVEWEGQEVQLLDPRSTASGASVASEDRMPPPHRNPAPSHNNHHHHHAEQTSVAFSSLGSCHSWMPEQFGSVGSFFGGGAGSRAESMDMDHYSAVHSTGGGTENYSAAGSLGGNSLTRVFEHEETVPDTPYSSSQVSLNHQQQQQQQHRNLSQVPSWDRSFRSRSPCLSIESSDDDASLMSKDDTTVSKPEMDRSNNSIPVSPVTHSTLPPPSSGAGAGGMVWETKE